MRSSAARDGAIEVDRQEKSTIAHRGRYGSQDHTKRPVLRDFRSVDEMAGGETRGPVAGGDREKRGGLAAAAGDCHGAARMERAARRRRDGTRDFASQWQTNARTLQLGIRYRHGSDQRLRVRMQRL